MTRINWNPNDHRRIPKSYPEQPTPREIRALQAVEDGSPLTVAASRLGIPVSSLGSILSGVYARLLVKDLGVHHLSQDRRRMAINICKREGWWPDGHEGSPDDD